MRRGCFFAVWVMAFIFQLAPIVLQAQDTMVWEGCSRDSSYYARLQVTVFKEHGQYESEAVLYDAEKHVLWRHAYAVGTLEDLWVTDSGTIVTVGCDPEHDGRQVTVNEIGQYVARTYTMEVEGPQFDSLEVVSMKDGCAVVKATLEDTLRCVAAVDTVGNVHWMRRLAENEYYVFHDGMTLVIVREEGSSLDRLLNRRRWVMYAVDNEGNEERTEVMKPTRYELNAVEELGEGRLQLEWRRGNRVRTTILETR